MPSQHYTETRQAAYRYRKAGLSVLPIDIGGAKQPYAALLPFANAEGKPSWAPLQKRLPNKNEMKVMFPGTVPQGVAIIGGEVSGGLEMIDVDDQNTWLALQDLVNKEAPGLLQRIPQVQSPRDGGGRHLYVFSDCPGGCVTLAAAEDGSKLIEVKGRGGYCIAPGSHQKCHPDRREYQHVAGTPPIEERPKVTDGERSLLFACATSFNRCLDEDIDKDREYRDRSADQNAPGNLYIKRETFVSTGLLEKHGWQRLGEYAGRIAWARPGREDRPGFSALSGPDRFGHDRLTVYSSKGGPLKEQHSYNLFQAYALLECKGDFGRAALRLTQQGYVSVNQPTSLRVPHELMLWRPFPTHLLPEPCAEYVRAVSAVLSCDEAFIAIPLLGVLGGAIGYRRAAVFRSDYVQPATVWVGIIAPSGTIKTPAARAAARFSQQLQDKAYARYRGEKTEYEEQKELYDEWKRQRNRKIEDRPQVPDKPICQRYIVDDITVEKLAVVLQENPAGVLVCRDELAGWLTSFDQYRRSQGADENRWLEIWNGQWLTVDRKSNDEPIRIRRPSVSIVGTIQPRVFQRVVTQSRLENGLAQRVLWAKPPVSTQRWSKAGISAKLSTRMERLYSQLTGLEMEEGDHGPDPVLIGITGEAGDLWSDWYEDFDRRAHEQDELIRSAWTKLHVYAARFALIIHVVRQATGSSEDGISVESVRAAIALAEWFAEEIRRVYTVMRADEEDAALIELAAAIHHRGGQVTVGDLARSGPRNVRGDATAAKKQLTRLVEKEWGKWQSRPAGDRGGRPTQVFVLHASGYETSKNFEKWEVSYPAFQSETCATPDPGDEIVEVVV